VAPRPARAVALWWCSFRRAEPVGVERAEAAEDAGAVGLWRTWTLTFIVLAPIAIADTVQGDVRVSVGSG
jgi:hypothetical protein